jgi:acetyl esterase/lipase
MAVAATWLLIPSLALCFLALWIVLPPIASGLLPLTVGVPELSPWFLIVSLLLCALTFRSSAVDSTARATAYVAAAAALLFAYPLVRLPFALATFDRAMQQGLGAAYEDQIPTVPRFELRMHAISPQELVRGIAESDVLVRRGIEFARPAGVPLTADVYRPLSTGVHPVLLQIYGGAWQRGSPEDNPSFASWFASRGYVIVACDYRHAPEAKWPAQAADVRAAIDWVIGHAGELGADTSRIALLGRSAGAQLALVAAYQHGSPARAVVSYYGPTDLAEGWRVPPRPDPLDIRSILETYLGGVPDRLPMPYRDASPVTYADARVPPTLLIYGSRDHVVEARFGRELHERLRAVGATSVLLEIAWADHAFDAIPNGLSAQISLYYTERFLAWALR